MTTFPPSNFSSSFDGKNGDSFSSIRPNGALLQTISSSDPSLRSGKPTETPQRSYTPYTPSFEKQRAVFGTQDGSSLRGSSSQGKYGRSSKRKVFSVSQILARVNQKKQRKFDQKKRKKPLKPIIPPKSFLLLFQSQGNQKYVYNRRILDYKHCGLLQRYIGVGGKILPRRQTKLTAKQQRYVAKTIKSARIMGLLPFVTKERGFFR
jgi:ribosomal protein S18